MNHKQQSTRHPICHQQIAAIKPPCCELLPEGTKNVDNSTLEALFSPVQGETLCYRCFYKNNPPVYLCVDSNGKILSVNRLGALSLGYVPEDLLQKSVFQLFAASEIPSLAQALTKLLNQTVGNQNHYWHFQLDCPGCDLVWVKINARMSASKDHKPLILMVFEDITACKHTKDTMEESEQGFGAIGAIGAMVDDLPVMLWMSKVDGCYSVFNKHLLGFIGCDRLSMSNKAYRQKESDVNWLGLIHPEDRDLYLDNFNQAFYKKQQFQIEYRCRRGDGKYRWILDRGSPRFDRYGDFAGYIGSCVDITESKLAKIALQENQKALQLQFSERLTLNRLKDEFLGTVSHELRTPLTNMKMAIQMLGIALQEKEDLLGGITNAEDRLQSKVDLYFQILSNECEREISLINNFLDLQRLDTSSREWVLESISIPEWLVRVVKLFKSRHCNSCKHDLQLDIATDLPLLTCDPFSLERIIIELLTNACKFSPSGERIIVSVQQAKSQNIQFQITNTGVEIPEAELAHIFDKFYQIPSNDPWKTGGTGLGLALVQKLTESLGGTVVAKSDSNCTCFTIQLPGDKNTQTT